MNVRDILELLYIHTLVNYNRIPRQFESFTNMARMNSRATFCAAELLAIYFAHAVVDGGKRVVPQYDRGAQPDTSRIVDRSCYREGDQGRRFRGDRRHAQG